MKGYIRRTQRQKTTKKLLIVTAFVVAFGVITGPLVMLRGHNVQAATIDELRAQSNSLQQQINDNNQLLQQLASQADTLENKLAILNTQISQLQSQIDLTAAKINELQIKLDQAQAELDHQKSLLKASLQALYKKGGASTVELLVGSDSFSQFINDQTYLERLKSSIQTSTEKVLELKQQIQSQQDEQKQLLSEQQGQQNALQQTRQEQQNLLADTRGQEASYQQRASDLKAQQSAILAQIVAQNQQLYGDGTRGGYPTKWADAPQDTVLDNWGMYNRECVSYTAFKVFQSGRNMPAWGFYLFGNAKDWLRSADVEGVPYDRNPQVGDVAIATFAPYGHAMYVEGVSGRTVYVSQYNLVHGQYSEMSVSADDSNMGPLYFIHFP